MEQFSLTDIKKKNLSDVYQYIYMNPSCSKQEIATALSVSLPTVTQHLTTLESQNLIEKCGRLSSSVGRRAVAYQILSNAQIAIGIEILSHTVRLLAVNLYGEAIAKDGLRKDNKNLIFLVAMITFASCGADNIGVFVPYFTTLNLANLIVTLLTFLVMIYLLVFSCPKIGTSSLLLEKLWKNIADGLLPLSI